MLDTHAVARSLTAAGFTPDQADAITNAVGLAAERGDHVTSAQFEAGIADLLSTNGERQQYRRMLLELTQKSQDSYDRLVIYLSVGAMGLSFTVVDSLIGGRPARELWALGGAWTMWTISVSAMLFSHLLSVQVLQEETRQFDKRQASTRGWRDIAVDVLNRVGGLAFVMGAGLAGWFLYYNL